MILNILNAGVFLLRSMFNNLLKLYIFPNDLFVLFIGLQNRMNYITKLYIHGLK